MWPHNINSTEYYCSTIPKYPIYVDNNRHSYEGAREIRHVKELVEGVDGGGKIIQLLSSSEENKGLLK